MEEICEVCGRGRDECLFGTKETKKVIISEGENDNLVGSGELYVSLSSFPKTIPPEIILGVEPPPKFTKSDVEELFGVRG